MEQKTDRLPRPVTSWEALSSNGVTIQWIVLEPGDFPVTLVRKLSVIATLGAGYELDIEHASPVHCDHGEIYLLPPSLRRKTSFLHRGEVLRVTFEDDVIRRVARDANLPDGRESLAFRKLTDPAVYEVVHLLAEEMRPGGARGAVYAEALGLALLGRVMRDASPPAADAAERGLAPQRLAQCKAFIEDHLAGDLTVAQIAAAVDMSTFHFARAFKHSTGTTPHAYVLERRIAAAKLLVRNTTRPLHEISQRFGFSSPSHFSAVFSRLSGASPSEYRLRGG